MCIGESKNTTSYLALCHCNTLQHTATHCNTLQHTATHNVKLLHTSNHSPTCIFTYLEISIYTYVCICTCMYIHIYISSCIYIRIFAGAYICNKHISFSNVIDLFTIFIFIQFVCITTHCNTLQHTATHCSTLFLYWPFLFLSHFLSFIHLHIPL